METPERIYFGEADKSVLDIYSTKEHDDEVEYVRKDVFIEKARKCFRKELPNFRSFMESGEVFIKNFENFMQEE